jgi:hypothetical protein
MELSTNRPSNIDQRNPEPGFTILPPEPEIPMWNTEEDANEERIGNISQGKLKFVLSKEEEAFNRQEMDKLIKNLDITWAKEKRKLTGTKPLTDSSLKAYSKHFRGLIYFLTLIKDHKSMLILQENAPRRKK